MNPKRQAKKILRLYGEAEYRARIDYIKGFQPEAPSFVGRIGWKHLGRRCLMIALLLTLALALAVVHASAFGIQLFGFNLFEYSDHTEITRDEDAVLEGEARFYEPTYVPEGYEMISADGFEDTDQWYVYQNEEGEYLYIDQSAADGFSSSINNEECTRENKEVDGMKVLIYRYYDIKRSIYIFNKGKMCIRIKSALNDGEFERIIRGLS